MLHYPAVFLVIALVAALLGFTGIAAGAVEIAKTSKSGCARFFDVSGKPMPSSRKKLEA